MRTLEQIITDIPHPVRAALVGHIDHGRRHVAERTLRAMGRGPVMAGAIVRELVNVN